MILGFFFTNSSTVLFSLFIVTIYYIVKNNDVKIFNIQADGLTALHPRPEGRGFTAVRIKDKKVFKN